MELKLKKSIDQQKGSREKNISKLVNHIKSDQFKEEFVPAYSSDTAFTIKNIIGREITTPAYLLEAERCEYSLMDKKMPLGKVVVLMPKNSLGLTLAKAVASSYLMGNTTIVYFPSSLKKTAPIYAKALTDNLENIEIAEFNQSSSKFIRTCMKDESIKAIVIYGDDAWIDSYKNLALQTKTKIIFEGPGNDPIIVAPNADISCAVKGAIEGGLNNGGQSCSAIERFFIHENIYNEFSKLLIAELKKLKCGSPKDHDTDIGPIASRIIFKRIIKQIEDSVEKGAVVSYGGDVLVDETTSLPKIVPAVLENCSIDMPVVKDETFGPVFPLIPYSSLSELQSMLDDTKYGLNACFYGDVGSDIENYLLNSHRNVYSNSTAASSVNLDSRLVDGGFKRSGILWDFEKSNFETSGIRNLAIELSK